MLQTATILVTEIPQILKDGDEMDDYHRFLLENNELDRGSVHVLNKSNIIQLNTVGARVLRLVQGETDKIIATIAAMVVPLTAGTPRSLISRNETEESCEYEIIDESGGLSDIVDRQPGVIWLGAVTHLCVSRDHRGKGLASTMIRALIHYGKRYGIEGAYFVSKRGLGENPIRTLTFYPTLDEVRGILSGMGTDIDRDLKVSMIGGVRSAENNYRLILANPPLIPVERGLEVFRSFARRCSLTVSLNLRFWSSWSKAFETYFVYKKGPSERLPELNGMGSLVDQTLELEGVEGFFTVMRTDYIQGNEIHQTISVIMSGGDPESVGAGIHLLSRVTKREISCFVGQGINADQGTRYPAISYSTGHHFAFYPSTPEVAKMPSDSICIPII